MTTNSHDTSDGPEEPKTASGVGPAPRAGGDGAGDAAFAPGEKIGAYTVVEQISAGGFGRVLRAHRVEPVSHDVAIKTLLPDRDAEAFKDFFEAERRVLASLDHPNIARFIDAGETPDGAPYLVMEYVRGEPMTAFARMNRLTLQDRARLVAQACRGAHHAHEMGLVHRDIKPDNLLVSYVGGEPSVKIVDFGLAHLLGPSAAFARDANARVMAGTPGYLSPEQEGRSRLDIDRRADVWSLAATMHVLAVGRAPMPVRDEQDGRVLEYERASAALAGADAEKLATERRCSAGELGGQVRSLEPILGPALDPDRQRRPSTAQELGRALEAWASGGGGATGTARVQHGAGATEQREPTRGGRAPLLFGLGVLTVVLVGGGVAGGVWLALRGAEEPTREPLAAATNPDAHEQEPGGSPPPEGAEAVSNGPDSVEPGADEPPTDAGSEPDREAMPAPQPDEAPTGADEDEEAPPDEAPGIAARVAEALPLDLIGVRVVGGAGVVSGPVINSAEVERAGRLLGGLDAETINELRPDAGRVRRELRRRIREAGVPGIEVMVRNENETFGRTYIFVRLGIDAPDDAASRVAELARGLALDPTLIRTTN